MTRDELALAIGDWIMLALVAGAGAWVLWGFLSAFL
jgi:hypothetical protein